MSRRNKEPIKIIKPYKFARQKNESPTDAVEALSFISTIIKSIGPSKTVSVVSNMIETDTDIISNPKNVVNQMLESQKAVSADPDGRGKRIYSMIYRFPREYDVNTAEVSEFAEELILKYPDFQSIALINKSEENGDICCGIAFNNYSSDGSEKMSKRYRPYHMSNIYNRYIDRRDREDEELYGYEY